MLTTENIRNLMKEHFPRWMDIRKRILTSKGGNLVTAIAEEIASIQEAIEAYKKEFFLVNHLDKYDDVIYYLYYIYVGDISDKNLTVIKPENLFRVDTIDEFYSTPYSYYYEDNKLYFKPADVSETDALIQYSLNDYAYSALINKLYVWNIYDEFAAFVGIKRHTDESNKELTNRILNVFKNLPNSTDLGLKSAIINDTLNFLKEEYPYKTTDEYFDLIQIEHPTPENLQCYYDKFTTIIDKLGLLNRDVYQYKQWDVNVWEYKLSSLDYLPHAWDYILEKYQNGIGFKDDLKTEIITDNTDSASCDISIYLKDIAQFNAYVANNKYAEIQLQLKRYNDEINATRATYKISASAPYNITDELNSIYFVSSLDNSEEHFRLSDIIAENGLTEDTVVYVNNVTRSFIVDNIVLDDVGNQEHDYSLYRIKFSSDFLSKLSDKTKRVYSFINLPSNIGSAFVYSKTESSENTVDITNKFSGEFQYCYLYIKDSITYVANNAEDLFVNDTTDIEIVDNFSPLIPSNQLMVYVAEGASNCTPIFQNNHGTDNDQIISSWSFGKNKLTLKTIIDYNNVDIISYALNKSFVLSNSIPLEQQYDFEDNTLDLREYIVTCTDPNIKVTYLSYTGSLTNPDYESEYIKSCSIPLNDKNNYIKLPYSMIDRIFDIQLINNNGDSIKTLSTNDYYIRYDEGIIILNDNFSRELTDSLEIVFSIKIAKNLSVDINTLYDYIAHNINAYTNFNTIHLSNVVTDGYIYSLSSIKNEILNHDQYANQADDMLITINNLPNNYSASISDDNIVFRKIADQALSVKYGYYYFGEQEYYLLPEIEATTDSDFVDVDFVNTVVEDGNIIFNRENHNFIQNSNMILGRTSNTYNVDLIKNQNVIGGSSVLGALSSCSTYDKWHTFGTELNLTPAANDFGIQFTPYFDNGYGYLDITTDIGQRYYINLHITGNLRAFIAKEYKYDTMTFHKSVNAELLYELLYNKRESTLSIDYIQEPDYKYYLVILGNGILDNIILVPYSQAEQVNHETNMSKLGLNINEVITTQGYINRAYFDNHYSTLYGAEIDHEGYIINATNYDWGMTKLVEYSTNAEFQEHFLTNNISIQSNAMLTYSEYGNAITKNYIYLEDKHLINRLIFEINDIPFDNMDGFQIRFASSETPTGQFEYLNETIISNTGSINVDELIGPYIKMHIIMPDNRIIGNIALYAEYKQTDSDEIAAQIINGGSLLSHIIDTHYQAKYRISKIDIDNINDINIDDYKFEVRAARADENNIIWTNWSSINLSNTGEIINYPVFDDYRLFQIKVTLNTQNARIKLNKIDIQEVL